MAGRPPVLPLRPGFSYYALWFMFLLFSAWDIFVAFVPAPARDEPNRRWFVLVLTSFAFFSAVGVLYYRSPRFLEVDRSGVRLLRGKRRQRELPWELITKVRYGTKLFTVSVHYARFARESYLLDIRGQGRRGRIRIDDASFRVSRTDLEAAATLVASMAGERFIHVDRVAIGGKGFSPPRPSKPGP